MKKLALLTALVFTIGIAQATVIISTLEPNPGPGTNTVGNTTDKLGAEFTVDSTSYYLDEITIATWPTDNLQIELYDDNGGDPGNLIETLAFDSQFDAGSNYYYATFAASGSTVLSAGADYHVVLSMVSGSIAGWGIHGGEGLTLPATSGPGSAEDAWESYTDGGGWTDTLGTTNQRHRFEVVGTVVPEPATMALLGLGGLLLRRKK